MNLRIIKNRLEQWYVKTYEYLQITFAGKKLHERSYLGEIMSEYILILILHLHPLMQFHKQEIAREQTQT